MVSSIYQSQKKVLTYSKKQISKAGRALRKGATGQEALDAIDKIQDFRASHSYPLMLIKNHLWRTAKKIDDEVIIARRLKRLPTILDKLQRPSLDGKTPNSLDVTRMQDIGGCRAIFNGLKDVYALLDSLQKSRTVHSIVRFDDYIENPKPSGYRGLHLVYSCYSGTDEDSFWKGHKIEVQIRTINQHAWSTAIELVDLYERTSLKTSSSGDDDWRLFFSALASAFSVYEKISSLPDEERTREAIFGDDPLKGYQRYLVNVETVRTLAVKLDVIAKLVSYTMALDSVSIDNKKNGVYVLAIYANDKNFKGHLKWFKDSDRDKAIELYDNYELDQEVYQTVLVGAQGAGTLAQAYPNFFADTRRIVEIIGVIIDEDPPLITRRGAPKE